MSIDWSVHLRPVRFTVGELVSGTHAALSTLLHREQLTLVVYDDTRFFWRSRIVDADELPPRATNGFLQESVRSELGLVVSLDEDPQFIAAADVIRVPSEDSIDAEEHLLVTPWRTARSFVVAIALAVAAARLARNPVRDDPPLPSDELEADPDELLSRLALATGTESLAEAAAMVIARTKLRA